MEKKCPLNREELEKLAREWPTPFYIYDEQGIRDNARRLNAAFSWNPGFKEYFAVKATPNPFILQILKEEGFGADCSSLAELVLAEKVGFRGEDIMFTSNDTPANEFAKARELGAIINYDDISHIDFVEQQTGGLPEMACCRYNPGAAKEGNPIIGHPEDAKYGFTREQIFEGYRMMSRRGVKRFGLHAMVASNELEAEYFIETAEILFELVAELSAALGIRFEFVNIGGGIGIPYRPGEKPVDIEKIGAGIRHHHQQMIAANGLGPLDVRMECGRVITGPYGWLVARVLHRKDIYKKYVGLDACMADLMRPGMYGAYHHITVPGKEHLPHELICDVTGSLCENNDKFAIDRALPAVESGDFVVIHDTGAHGHAMGFNYNGKLRPAELLLHGDGNITPIRRAETLDDLFATLDFPAFRQWAQR